jgi:cobalt-zinc-cadmium efflux system protein
MAHESHAHHAPADRIGQAFWLNLAFTLIEIVGGFWTNSFAILSDALHDLGDSISLGLAWYFQRLSKRGRSPQFTYGYKRFNTLGAIITGTVLVGGSVWILSQALPRLWAPEAAHAPGMIGLAVLGVLVNGWAFFRLRAGGHSLNEQVLSWHLLEDVLGWVAVLIGSILMYFFDLPWIDPALSIGITVYVLYNVIKRLRTAGRVILQATPEGLDYNEILTALNELAGIDNAHHLHLWTLDGEYHLASVHLVPAGVPTLAEQRVLKQRARRCLHEFGIEHATLEIESAAEAQEHDPPGTGIGADSGQPFDNNPDYSES